MDEIAIVEAPNQVDGQDRSETTEIRDGRVTVVLGMEVEVLEPSDGVWHHGTVVAVCDIGALVKLDEPTEEHEVLGASWSQLRLKATGTGQTA